MNRTVVQMIKIENAETVGWEAAIRGMRNPMNSWDKSDSCVDGVNECKSNCFRCEFLHIHAMNNI